MNANEHEHRDVIRSLVWFRMARGGNGLAAS